MRNKNSENRDATTRGQAITSGNRSKTFSSWRYKRRSFIMGRIERGRRGMTRINGDQTFIVRSPGAMFSLIDFLLGDGTFSIGLPENFVRARRNSNVATHLQSRCILKYCCFLNSIMFLIVLHGTVQVSILLTTNFYYIIDDLLYLFLHGFCWNI